MLVRPPLCNQYHHSHFIQSGNEYVESVSHMCTSGRTFLLKYEIGD